jgi:DNA repair photolyase
MPNHPPAPAMSAARPKARGAASNAAGRFEPYSREAFDDGWQTDEDLPPLRTEVPTEVPRRVITRNTSPDVPFDRSINPYRGCEHGCVYCFARPSHAFLGLSPGLDFETRITAKPEAPARLAAELSRPSYRPAPIAIGTNTDPYQPIERRLGIMRGILEVLRDFGHPVTVVTKGALIERDADILGAMGRAGLARVGISLTTLDRDLARSMEPRAAAPERRLTVIRRLVDAGVPVRAMIAPVVPGLTDHEIEALLTASREAGASAASYVLLRLPMEVGPLFREWLETARPLRAAAVMARVRDMQGGRDYDPAWHRRMSGSGIHAELLARRFEIAARRLGLGRDLPALRADLFVVPRPAPAQMELF